MLLRPASNATQYSHAAANRRCLRTTARRRRLLPKHDRGTRIAAAAAAAAAVGSGDAARLALRSTDRAHTARPRVLCCSLLKTIHERIQ